MSNYIITSDGSFVSGDELYHYGVLGMKWGVRKNPAQAYEKASKKMTKLNNRVEKAEAKYRKKAHMHLTDFGVSAENRAFKKAARANAKAVEWKKAMDKTFSNTKLSSIEQKYVSKGEAYLNKIESTNSTKMQNIYSNVSSKNYAKSKDVADLRKRLYDG